MPRKKSNNYNVAIKIDFEITEEGQTIMMKMKEDKASFESRVREQVEKKVGKKFRSVVGNFMVAIPNIFLQKS